MSVFEIVRGVEGDCLVLDGTRICGPKPWGGGRIIKTFHTDGIYEVIDKDEYQKLQAENAKLRELLADAWGYINHPADATWTHKKRKEVRDSIGDRMRELGVEL